MWTQEITEAIGRLNGTAGVLVKNLRTGETFAYNEEMVFPAASIIKVPILLTLLSEHAKGNLDMNQPAPLTEEEIVRGYGVIQHLGAGINFSLLHYAVLMITLSDNTATNKLISTLGISTVNEKIKSLGMTDTVLQRKMMDFEAAKKGLDNLTSPRDLQIIFEYINNHPQECAVAMDILKAQFCNDLLPVWTKHDFAFAHKTGDLTGSKHDAGIMFLNDPIFVAVLTKGMTDNNDGVRMQNEIGRILYEHFQPTERLAAEF